MKFGRTIFSIASLLVVFLFIVITWNMVITHSIIKSFYKIDLVTCVSNSLDNNMIISYSRNYDIISPELIESDFEKMANKIARNKANLYCLLFPYKVKFETDNPNSLHIVINNIVKASMEITDLVYNQDTYVVHDKGTYITNYLPLKWGNKKDALKMNFQNSKEALIRAEIYGFNPEISKL